MKTTDSVKDKFIKWLAEESGEPEHLVMLMQSVYVNPESMLKFYSHSLAEARREELERFIKLWNEHCKEYTETDKYWADRFAKKLGDLLTGDNPERK